jgi:hypothetical protein
MFDLATLMSCRLQTFALFATFLIVAGEAAKTAKHGKAGIYPQGSSNPDSKISIASFEGEIPVYGGTSAIARQSD